MRFLFTLLTGSFLVAQSSLLFAQEEVKIPERESSKAVEQEVPNNVTAAAVYHTCKNYFVHQFNSADRENVGRKSSCLSYFFGAGSMLLLLKNEGVQTGYCLPPETSTEDLIKMFNQWMENNQERSKDIATVALLASVKENYPCDSIVPLGASPTRVE